MSRQSNDHYEEGRLIHGFDYERQAWVINGKYQDCGHPDTMDCACYGRQHAGEETRAYDADVTPPPGPPIGYRR